MEKFIFGAIFDWDGVIMDSSRQHEASWEALAKENGKRLDPDFFKKGFGMKNRQIIPQLLKWTEDPVEIQKISDRKEVLYREFVHRMGLEPLPGSVEWIKTLRAMDIPCVIASSTDLQNIQLGLQLLDLEKECSQIVSAEDVTLGKPHPDVFLKAAEKIGFPPSQCIVFEDAPVGIQAAQRAGIKVVALQTSHSPENLQEADLLIKNLSEMTLELAKRILTS